MRWRILHGGARRRGRGADLLQPACRHDARVVALRRSLLVLSLVLEVGHVLGSLGKVGVPVGAAVGGEGGASIARHTSVLLLGGEASRGLLINKTLAKGVPVLVLGIRLRACLHPERANVALRQARRCWL